MANRSKEAERQNKALQNILEGKPVEKDYVQVGYQGKKPEDLGGKTRKSELTDIMAEVRMPWFCPECKKAMKKKLDDKFWRIKGHCFDCQVEFENKLRMKGEFEDYAQLKILENQKAYLIDMEQSIDEFEKSGGKKTWLNNVGVNTPELEKEKWEMGKKDFENQVTEARKFIQDAKDKVEDFEKQIQGDK